MKKILLSFLLMIAIISSAQSISLEINGKLDYSSFQETGTLRITREGDRGSITFFNNQKEKHYNFDFSLYKASYDEESFSILFTQKNERVFLDYLYGLDHLTLFRGQGYNIEEWDIADSRTFFAEKNDLLKIRDFFLSKQPTYNTPSRNNSASAPTYESKVSIIDNIKSRLPRNISVYDMIQYECGLKELGKPFSNEYASLFDKFISLGWASKGWHSIRTENNLKVLGKEIDHISYVDNSKDYTYFFKFEDDKSARKFFNLIKKDFSQFAFIYFERKDTDISIIYKLNNPIQNIEQIALRLNGTTISITLYASALIPNFPQ